MVQWARRSGELFDPARLGKQLDEGGEHAVHSAADQRGKVYKVTSPGYAGSTRVAHQRQDGVRVTEDDALPNEYLDRWTIHNEVFGGDVTLEGVLETPQGPRFVVSQRLLKGNIPSVPQVHKHLADELKFVPTGDGHWYRAADNVALADTKPANFIVDEKGQVLAVDVITFRPTAAMLKVWGLPAPAPNTSPNPAASTDDQSSHPMPPPSKELSQRFLKSVGTPSEMDTDQERRVFEGFRDRVSNNVPGAVREYIERFGHVVDTDSARELEPAYSASRESRQQYSRATSPVASALAREVYDTLLEEAPPGDILFNAGGPGSGKSRTLEAYDIDRFAIVYDTVMADSKRAVEQIERGLKKGHKITIRYIHQPIDAAIRNSIERSADARNGRIVEAYALARAHVSAQQAIFEVARHFNGNSAVTIRVVDNTEFKAKDISLQQLKQLQISESLEKLEERAMDVARQYFDENRTRPEFTPELQGRVLRAPSRRRSGPGNRTP
ncbi:MAG: hypothetical protein ACAH88_02810 [Roseimicrobium sp.]